jgi:streptogramin lyase
MSASFRRTRRAGLWLIVPIVIATAVGACGGEEAAPPPAEGIDVADVGVMTPESVLADTAADMYYVTNINGSPVGKDDNGFISKLNPDGTVAELKWIDGESPTITLNAPKGMALRADTLYVADIDCIRRFNKNTGEQIEGTCVDGATFLNDIAIGPEGSLFITDSGLQGEGMAASGTDAIYRFAMQKGRVGATLANRADLGHPNGVAVSSRGIFVVTFGSGEILRLTPTGEITVVGRPSNRQYDGIVFTNDGGFLVSAWGDSAVHRFDSTGKASVLLKTPTPADIGYDAKRNRVLVPVFSQNKVLIRDVK